ncbi:hypothetical protein Bmyc01_29180 [Bacillus mycoides]|nr:hypothetical protein Bmyc01_29180 [Bacillus mycoides]
MLNINSKTIKDDIMNIHGIMPCKSFNIEFPFVPEEFLHHFVRGYFDGDGYVNYEAYTVSYELFKSNTTKSQFTSRFTRSK